jgi:hypothetical protein
MSSEMPADKSIDDHEGILRRIAVGWLSDPSGFPQVIAFYPRKPSISIPEDRGDHDGLSVIREIITEVAIASVSPTTKKKYHVARLIAHKIFSFDLTIECVPQDHDPGHSLIPEMNIIDYTKDPDSKKWIQGRAALLATNCEMAHIVHA